MITTPDVIAEARHVTRRYPGVVALDNVDFSVRRGEVRALLGQNGAGKSTLIRLLSGVQQPTEGEILLDGVPLGGGGIRAAGERGVATCYQELSLVPDLSIAENLNLGRWPRGRIGLDRRKMHRSAVESLGRLGLQLDPNLPVGSLTLAQQQIVEIARALQGDPRLLILDEPTSALATAEVALVLGTVRRIAESGVAVIYVSHRMDEIRQVASSATIMRNGLVIDTIDVDKTDTSTIVRLMIGEAGLERHVAVARSVGSVLLEVEGLSQPPKLRSASFSARRGEVLGIAGLLGSGRSELLRAIAGFAPITHGRVLVDGVAVRPTAHRMKQLGVGLTPENRKRDGIFSHLGVDENIVISDFSRVEKAGVISNGAVRSSTEALGSQLKIKTAQLSDPISTLSGGNQQKAVIARWLHAGSRILLLDEPTRGVDVGAKAQIYQIMREVADAGNSVLFVSSELEELPLVCDRVLILRDGAIRDEMKAPDIDLSKLLEATMASHE